MGPSLTALKIDISFFVVMIFLTEIFLFIAECSMPIEVRLCSCLSLYFVLFSFQCIL
jgi:hypothetical protein